MVTVSGSTFRDASGAIYYRYSSSFIGSDYASGSFRIQDKRGNVEYTLDQARQKAEQATAQYFGIPSIHEDEARLEQERQQQAVTAQLHAKREALRQGYAGTFSDEALRDVTTDPGYYLPSYIKKLPQAQAETLIREGRIGGWEINGRYFRTQQEANNFINLGAARTAATTQGKPWQPGAYPQLQVSKDIQKKFEDQYEPYVTIEGTTIHRTKGAPPTSVTVPRFGKMIPSEGGEAWGGVIQPDKFTKATDKYISENFEKGNRFVSDKLMLHEILNPVIKKLESAKIAFKSVDVKAGRPYHPLSTSESSEFAIGALTEIRDKPLTAAGNAAFMILVTKGAGALVSKAPLLAAGIGTGKIARNINAVNVLGASLAAMYGYDIKQRITTSESPARTGGAIAATELIPFGVGGYLGTKKLPSLQKMQLRNSISARKILSSDSMTGKLWKEPTPEYIQAQSKAHNILNPSTGRHPAGIKSITGYKEPTTIKGDWWKEPTNEYTQARYKAMDILQRGDLKSLSEYVKEPFQLVKPKIIKSVEKPTYPKLPKQLGEVKLIGKVTYKKDLTSIIKARQQARMAEYESLMKSGEYIVTRQGQILLTKQKTVQKTKTVLKEKAISKTETKQASKVVQTTKTKQKTVFPMVAINAYATTANRNISQVKAIFKQIPAQTTQQQTRTQQTTRQVTVQISRQVAATKAIAAQRAKQIQKQVTAQKAKQVAAQKPKTRVPERPVKLGLPKFSQEVSRIAKKQTNRGKYIWDVNNPVPTLEEFIGRKNK